jgi:hypothetical protein
MTNFKKIPYKRLKDILITYYIDIKYHHHIVLLPYIMSHNLKADIGREQIKIIKNINYV